MSKTSEAIESIENRHEKWGSYKAVYGMFPLCKEVRCSPEFCASAKKCCENAMVAFNSVASK